MKSILKYTLIIFLSTLSSCQSQVKNELKIKISSVKDSIKCKNDNFFFEFPDIFGKNENNFFNNIIIKDCLNYLDTKKSLTNPKEIINGVIAIKRENCDDNNFSGLVSTNYDITFNNLNLVSIKMNYESLAGDLNKDTYYYNFDIPNRKIINHFDILKKEKINELLKHCNKILKQRLKELYNENKDDLKDSDTYKTLSNSKLLITENDLDTFSIRDNNIEFIYDFNFRKGDFDIENNLLFSYKEIEPFLKDDFKKKLKK